MPSLKKLLYQLKSRNLATITQEPSQEFLSMDPREIWTTSRQLRLQNLKKANTEVLQELLIDINNEYKIPYDDQSIISYTRAQILIDLYSSFYKSVQIFSKSLTEQKLEELVQTPSTDFEFNEHDMLQDLMMEIDNPPPPVSPSARSIVKKTVYRCTLTSRFKKVCSFR